MLHWTSISQPLLQAPVTGDCSQSLAGSAACIGVVTVVSQSIWVPCLPGRTWQPRYRSNCGCNGPCGGHGGPQCQGSRATGTRRDDYYGRWMRFAGDGSISH